MKLPGMQANEFRGLFRPACVATGEQKRKFTPSLSRKKKKDIFKRIVLID